MKQDVARRSATNGDRQQYRDKVRRCLDALAIMLDDGRFSFQQRKIGLEIELDLINEQFAPAMANATVLEKINDPSFTTELGQQNVEVNVAPRTLHGDQALWLEREFRATLNAAGELAAQDGVTLVMIGTLPTLRSEHFDPKWLSDGARYALLNAEIFAARGEDMQLRLDGAPMPDGGTDRLCTKVGSILPESACTSVQLHVQTAPEDFAAYWNAAQCLAGVQVALGANSPFLLGKALWHETRIPLFLQATDTRPAELANQGVRPRVWFGERWIGSIFDLFEENARYFPGLLAETSEEDPLDALAEGRAPELGELRLLNGTIWRWNRPVYDIVDGAAHLRLENRVLPAGPTVLDMMANAAFFYGAQRALAALEPPLWTQLSFDAAEENLIAGAKYGMAGRLYWPGIGWVPPDELTLGTLLPMAHAGLREIGMSDTARERYLGVIEQRCLRRRTGAGWQRDTVALLEERGVTRENAVGGMFRRYVELMNSGQPVHSWPIGG
ncbi:MAG TPA: glutamate-cysteine ligase family protein [Pseudonocardiaceae bacterium]|jgi:hypothetical protein|nr:glutamate-cysteine ligase family protein [Pseudonocardiaceae bacterium]